MPEKVNCRYLKISNIKVPSGHFAISGFRVFGKGNGKLPVIVNKLEVTRNPENRRTVKLKWGKSENATGYNINFGYDKNKLYHSYIVYQDTSVTINSLNANQKYYFSIEVFNKNGVTPSENIIMVE